MLGDEFAVAGQDPDVVVVDEHEDVLSLVGSSDSEVVEFAGVAECDFAGSVDAVVADAELAGVADRGRGRSGFDACVVGGAGCGPVDGSVRSDVVVVADVVVEVGLELAGGAGPLVSEVLFEGLVEAFDAPMFVKRRVTCSRVRSVWVAQRTLRGRCSA